MRYNLHLIPTTMLLVSAACSMRPMEASMPRPTDVLLRVTTFASCLPGDSCPSEPGALRWEVDVGNAVDAGLLTSAASGAAAGAYQGIIEGEAAWERVTLLQIRQQLCRCPNPDPPKSEPTVRPIP